MWQLDGKEAQRKRRIYILLSLSSLILAPHNWNPRLISDYSSIQLSHATWHQISACSWETPCASSCKISIPLCRDWDHREHMKFDIISSVTLLPNSLRGYQWFQGLWNLTIRNLQLSSCAKLYRCFSIFLCNPEHSCAQSHNYKQLKELVNKESYRAFTAWVMAKALLHYPFRARWTWRTCVCCICAMPNLLLFGLPGVLGIWTWLWPMTSVVTHIKWHQIHHRKNQIQLGLMVTWSARTLSLHYYAPESPVRAYDVYWGFRNLKFAFTYFILLTQII